jgi:hypothetical protein
MTWLTWRQHRNQVYFAAAALAALAILLLITGLQMASQYRSALASCAASHNCGNLADTLFLGSHAVGFLVILTLGVPALLGLFWGAPLVAQELETGTSQFAWMQSITRTRWLAVKTGWLLLAAAAWGGAVSALVTWWSGPDNALQRDGFALGRFDIQGLVPVGYALFAVALGLAAGALLRRTLPALAVTLAVFVALRTVIAEIVRPHYMTAITAQLPAPWRLHAARVLLAARPGRHRAERPGDLLQHQRDGDSRGAGQRRASRLPVAAGPQQPERSGILPHRPRVPRVHHLPAGQPVLGVPGHRDRHLRPPRRHPGYRDRGRRAPP